MQLRWEINRQDNKHWFQLSSTHLRANFRGARAYRSPCSAGVKWNDISCIVTRVSPSGRTIRDARPRELGITEKRFCYISGSCDILVDVDLSSGVSK